MKSVKQLPEGYRPLRQIDLQADRRAFWIVNGLALAILVALAAAGALMVPLETVFSANGVGGFVAKAVVMIVGSIAYIVGHEWVHGIFMKYFSDAKVSYGFTGLYAYAGSSAYFCKRHYRIIALAPVVLWGVLLAALNLLLPQEWFWPIYFIQMTNLSGAAGDLYVSLVLKKYPPEILIQDSGIAMTIYGCGGCAEGV